MLTEKLFHVSIPNRDLFRGLVELFNYLSSRKEEISELVYNPTPKNHKDSRLYNEYKILREIQFITGKLDVEFVPIHVELYGYFNHRSKNLLYDNSYIIFAKSEDYIDFDPNDFIGIYPDYNIIGFLTPEDLGIYDFEGNEDIECITHFISAFCSGFCKSIIDTDKDYSTLYFEYLSMTSFMFMFWYTKNHFIELSNETIKSATIYEIPNTIIKRHGFSSYRFNRDKFFKELIENNFHTVDMIVKYDKKDIEWYELAKSLSSLIHSNITYYL